MQCSFVYPLPPQIAHMSQLGAKHEHVDISGLGFKEHKGFPSQCGIWKKNGIFKINHSIKYIISSKGTEEER